MYGRRVLIPALTVVLVIAAVPLLAQRGNSATQKPPQRAPQEQQDVQALVAAVDAALMSDVGITVPAAGAPPSAPVTAKPLAFGAGDRTEGGVSVKWQSNHFLKGGTGETYLPFTVALDRSQLAKGAALYVRIVNAEQAAAFGAYTSAAAAPQGGKAAPPRPTFAWDSVAFLDVPASGEISRAVQLKPGQYVAFVAAKEKSAAAAAAPAGVGLLRHELVVPDFNSGDLRTSSVIIAQSVETLSPSAVNDQESNPYVFGPMRITPSFDGRFAKSGELNVFLWIYGAKEAASGKPDVLIDFRFHQRLAEGEKYFNRTEPQQLNAQTLPAEFSTAAGHQLLSTLGVRLTSFPVGDYRLEIKVTDRPTGRELTQSVNFSVVA
jgi:hypothetical protein